MASITQTIPTYAGGMSEQPDYRKFGGQVKSIVNGIPDVVTGLYKRPGSKRIGTTKLGSVEAGGSWFHYYRSESEGSYIGQVDADGDVRVWKASGLGSGTTAQTIRYGPLDWEATKAYSVDDEVTNDSGKIYVCDTAGTSAGSGGPTGTGANITDGTARWDYVGTASARETSIKTYLTSASSPVDPEDLQFITINDVTFVNNRSINVTTTGTTTARPHTNFAYIDLLRTENGRQYGLNISTPSAVADDSVKVATRVNIKSDNLAEGQGTGSCPGIGTQVFAVPSVIEHTIPTSAVASDVITKAAHGWTDGTAVRYNNGGGANMTGLSDNTIYYIRDKTADTFKVAATSGGTAIAVGSGTGNNAQFFSILPVNIVSVKNAAGTRVADGSRKNLIFRLTTLGQQGHYDYADNDQRALFRCTYNRQIRLLHGGEGWEEGDVVEVKLDSASTTYTYEIEIEKIETNSVKADVKAARPEPTPFDADTAVTADQILGGINAELDGVTVGSDALNTTIIGTGMYLYSNSAFNIETTEKDLVRVIQGQVNDVTELPTQCKHGYIVKVANDRMSDEDDYYLRFVGENDNDGTGTWTECAEPGIILGFDDSTMPHVIKRTGYNNSTGAATFTVDRYNYQDRRVGDSTTNPLPRFNGKAINKVLFFRNRITFLSEEYVICARPGSAAKPDFFAESALTTGTNDPIDIASTSTFPSDLFDGIETTAGLALFSTNQQFLLASDDTTFTPDTAKCKSISVYNYNKDIAPISLGVSTGFVDNSGKYSRFMEMFGVSREKEPQVLEVSKIVPSLLDKNIDLLCNSRENNIILFGKTGSNIVFGYKYLATPGKPKDQSAWFKWELNQNLLYHFIVNDTYYYLDSDHFLHSLNLIAESDDPSVTEESVDYLIHLDNWTTIEGGVYSNTDSLTTFTHGTPTDCVFNWQSAVTDSFNKLVLIDIHEDVNSSRISRYAECTVTSAGATFTVPGNWDYNEEHEFSYSNINASNEQITITDHGLSTGDKVRFKAGGTSPTIAGPTNMDGQIYYVIKASTNNIALASSLSNANSGVAVNIATQGTGVHRIQKLITNLYIGYLYDYQVDLPRIYLQKQAGQSISYDTNASLVVHRIKLMFGKIGKYSTTLTRVGKLNYTDTYESTDQDAYDANSPPYLPEKIKTIPVYEKNENVDITIKSAHPAPATLRGMSWEGDYSPKYYKRA